MIVAAVGLLERENFMLQCLFLDRLSWVSRIEGVLLQHADAVTVASVFSRLLVFPAALSMHRLWNLSDAPHQRTTQTFLGAPLLLEMRVVRQHLLPLVNLQLGVEFLQLLLHVGQMHSNQLLLQDNNWRDF